MATLRKCLSLRDIYIKYIYKWFIVMAQTGVPCPVQVHQAFISLSNQFSAFSNINKISYCKCLTFLSVHVSKFTKWNETVLLNGCIIILKHIMESVTYFDLYQYYILKIITGIHKTENKICCFLSI